MRALKAISIPISCGFVFAANIAIAQDSKSALEVNPCSYDEARPVSFTDWGSTDLARVRILGKNCENSTVLTTIEDAAGIVRYSHAAILYRLSVNRFDETAREDAMDVARSVWTFIGPHRTSELLPWAEQKEIYDLYDEVPTIDREQYESARASDRPYVCVKTYYEGADCFWFDPKWRQAQKLLDLAG